MVAALIGRAIDPKLSIEPFENAPIPPGYSRRATGFYTKKFPNLLNPYRFGGGFKPVDLSEVKIWTSAQAETGYSDGATLSVGWNNLVPGQPDPTLAASSVPKWKATGGPGGGPCLDIVTVTGANGAFNIPNVIGSDTSSEVFILVKALNPASGKSLWSSTGAGGAQHYPWVDSVVYENWFCNNRPGWTVGASPNNVNDWRVYNIRAAANEYDIWLDGVSKASYSGSSIQFQNGIGGLWTLFTGYSPFQGWTTSLIQCVPALPRSDHTKRNLIRTFLSTYPSGGVL